MNKKLSLIWRILQDCQGRFSVQFAFIYTVQAINFHSWPFSGNLIAISEDIVSSDGVLCSSQSHLHSLLLFTTMIAWLALLVKLSYFPWIWLMLIRRSLRYRFHNPPP